MERRSEERVPVDAEIRFRYPDVFRARVHDFCRGGLKADVPFSLEVDSPVEVEVFDGRLLAGGHVRWVTLEDGEIHVGIQFRPEDLALIKEISNWRGKLP